MTEPESPPRPACEGAMPAHQMGVPLQAAHEHHDQPQTEPEPTTTESEREA